MRPARKYYLSFIEEGVAAPEYEGFVGGRLEVFDGGHYAAEEIRFLTPHRSDFYRFRDEYDDKEVNKATLEKVRREIKAFQGGGGGIS